MSVFVNKELELRSDVNSCLESEHASFVVKVTRQIFLPWESCELTINSNTTFGAKILAEGRREPKGGNQLTKLINLELPSNTLHSSLVLLLSLKY